MGVTGLVLVAALTTAPAVEVRDRDAQGCGTAALGGAELSGGPRDGCLVDAFPARLEDEATWNVVLIIGRPGRFDARVRRRLFVYRLEGRRLVPRFLGSGPSSFDLVSAAPANRGLVVSVRAEGGAPGTMRCEFRGFPLVCEATP